MFCVRLVTVVTDSGRMYQVVAVVIKLCAVACVRCYLSCSWAVSCRSALAVTSERWERGEPPKSSTHASHRSFTAVAHGTGCPHLPQRNRTAGWHFGNSLHTSPQKCDMFNCLTECILKRAFISVIFDWLPNSQPGVS